MGYIVFDFDFPEKKTAEVGAIDAWWQETKPRLLQLGTMFWRTKGGARCVYRLPEGTLIASTDDATHWKKSYLARFIHELNDSSADGEPIVTSVEPLEKFYQAEDYHRDYYARNTSAGYCQVVINPKLEKVKEKFAELLQEQYTH
jgi:hypothetical protein